MLNVFQTDFVEGEQILDREESHHLVAVRRARAGEALTLLDGRGRLGRGTLLAADPRRALLRVEHIEVRRRDTPPLWLAQALPLGKTMDVIVQKSAELGVARIVPLLTRHSEVRLDDERAGRKADKWLQVAIEAVKQCGNPFLPEIDPPRRLDEFLGAGAALPPLRLVCSLENGSSGLSQSVRQHDTHGGAVIAIGPEGDFSADEYASMRAHGFLPVTLGPLVLRADTAAIAALANAGEAQRASR